MVQQVMDHVIQICALVDYQASCLVLLLATVHVLSGPEDHFFSPWPPNILTSCK